MFRLSEVAGALMLAAIVATSGLLASTQAQAQVQAQSEEDGQWTQPGKNFAATRYSGLDEITPANVGNLRSVFTF